MKIVGKDKIKIGHTVDHHSVRHDSGTIHVGRLFLKDDQNQDWGIRREAIFDQGSKAYQTQALDNEAYLAEVRTAMEANATIRNEIKRMVMEYFMSCHERYETGIRWVQEYTEKMVEKVHDLTSTNLLLESELFELRHKKETE